MPHSYNRQLDDARKYFETWVAPYSRKRYQYDKYLPEERQGLPPGGIYKHDDTNEAFKRFLQGVEYGRKQAKQE